MHALSSQKVCRISGFIYLVKIESKKKKKKSGMWQEKTSITQRLCIYLYWATEHHSCHLFDLLSKVNHHDHKSWQEFSDSKFSNVCIIQRKHTIPCFFFMFQPPLFHSQAAKGSSLGIYALLPSSPQHLSLVTQCCLSPL